MKRKLVTLLTTAVILSSLFGTAVFAEEADFAPEIATEAIDEEVAMTLDNVVIADITEEIDNAQKGNITAAFAPTVTSSYNLDTKQSIPAISYSFYCGDSFKDAASVEMYMNSAKVPYDSAYLKKNLIPGKGFRVVFLATILKSGTNTLTVNLNGKPVIEYTVNLAISGSGDSLSLSIKSYNVVVSTEDQHEKNQMNFQDVPSNKWYAEAVTFVYQQGLMNGVDANNFAPSQKCTREMMVRILYNAAGSPAVDGNNKFSDVKNGAWYANAVTWAVEKGITNGSSPTSFGVGNNTTREQVACFLYNYAKSEGWKISAPDTSILDKLFKDANQISGYARVPLAWAYNYGIVGGNTDGTINPKGNASRAEIAQMIMKFQLNVANQK